MYLKRTLGEELTLYKGLRFGYIKKKIRMHHRYESVVGVGGNIGDVKRRLDHLLVYLKKEKRVEVVRTALILNNLPFGYEKQEDFLNTIMILRTSMQPRSFLRFLLRTEKRFGRKRSFANAPRTLDLDIIFFDNRVVRYKELQIPHPHWHKRQSVVIPLLGGVV